MLECITAPKATTGAREILKAKLRAMRPQTQNPTIIDAVSLSDTLGREHGLYITADYLLLIWADLFKK